MFENIKAVIFDLDGVLLDSERYHNQAILSVLEKEGFPPDPDCITEYVGKTTPVFLREFYRDKGRELSEAEHARLVQAKKDEFWSLFKAEAHEGAAELVRGLRGGYKLAVASNSPEGYVRDNLASIGLLEFFEEVISIDDVERPKPAPDTFLKAAQKLGVEPGVCLVIEDSIYGVAAAKAAGMKCIAVTTNYPAEALIDADKIVASLAEVKLP